MIEEILNKQNIVISLTGEQLNDFANRILDGARSIYEKEEQPAEQYLTRKRTAKTLSVDLSTLWRWHKENYLRSIEVGGKRMYRMSDVKKILEG
ncbi:MAG: DNA-binding protein [Dysgonamonadaceae bacterium]|jgi:hypothetical protein|nr:DNA-binding protein [Dysgonamonadaceae bacterium]